MLKPVTVTVTTAAAGEDTVSLSYDGLLRVTGDEVRVSYTEKEDGGRTSTLIVLSPAAMTVTRRGAVDFTVTYAVGAPCTTLYRLGGMAFDARIVTEALTRLPAPLPAVDCTYCLTLGGEERRLTLSLRLAERSPA
ncbi:MAG: DUF1934 family protein [Clostridia bacterium]|nr:DUF1934 family protein [Clostridia bacterium]